MARWQGRGVAAVTASGVGAGGAGVACLACVLGVVLDGQRASVSRGGRWGEGMLRWVGRCGDCG